MLTWKVGYFQYCQPAQNQHKTQILFQKNSSPCDFILGFPTGRCNFSGQRNRSSFIVSGQSDNGTSSKSGTACQNPQRDVGRDGTRFWQPDPSRLAGQSRKGGSKTEKDVLKQVICSCPCPGTKGHRDRKISLSQDKGTTGRSMETLLYIQWLWAHSRRTARAIELETMLAYGKDQELLEVEPATTKSRKIWQKNMELESRGGNGDSQVGRRRCTHTIVCQTQDFWSSLGLQIGKNSMAL